MKTLTPKAAFSKVRQSAEQIRNDEPQAVGTVSAGDVIRQGDLYLVALGRLPKSITLDPITDRQLAPGTTQGSRHTVEGPAKMMRAKDAGEIAALVNTLVKDAKIEMELVGPVFRTDGPCTLAHPEHGDFKLPAGETFAVVYQRAFADTVRRQLD